LLVCSLVGLSGCASASSSAQAKETAQTHLVALANAICRESKITKESHASFLAHNKAELARVHALLNSARSVPAVSTYIADVAARKRLLGALPKAPKGSGAVFYEFNTHSHAANPVADIDDLYRLSVKIRADEHALGLNACIGPPPKAPIGG
jgi:hypothetical protein